MNSLQGHWFNQRVSTSTVSWHWYIAESKLWCVPSLRGSSYVTAVSQQQQFYSAAVQRCWGGKTLVWSARCDPFIWMWIERGRMKVDWIFSVQVDKDDRATVAREREWMNWDEDKTVYITTSSGRKNWFDVVIYVCHCQQIAWKRPKLCVTLSFH